MFHNFKNFIKDYIFFAFSLISFFIIISLSIGIHSYSGDFFKQNHNLYSNASLHSFLIVTDNNEITSYQNQLLDFQNFQKKFQNFLSSKDTNFDLTIVPEPILPTLKIISVNEFNSYSHYSLAKSNDEFYSPILNITCSNNYDDKDNIQETKCVDINSFLKEHINTKYKVFSNSRFEAIKSLSDKEIEKLPPENLTFLPVNSLKFSIDKQIMYGNIFLLSVLGAILSILFLFVGSIYFYKNINNN